MALRLRRLRANIYYLQKPLARFVRLLGFLAAILLVAGFAFHRLSDQQPMPLARAYYVTFFLMLGEHLLPIPEHALLQLLSVCLPPLGAIAILDGIFEVSYQLFRRDESGREWAEAMTKALDQHVVLCGLGKGGLRILQQLVKLGEQVAVLEKDPQAPSLAWARAQGVAVLIGNGREEGIFQALNIERAKSIVLATNDDLANLEMALDARKANPKVRVLLRMYDQELAAKVHGSMEIDLAFSTSELAAPFVATSSSDRSIANAFYVEERLFVVARLRIREKSELAGRTIGEIRSRHPLSVLSLVRATGTTYFPRREHVFEVGDEVHVQTEPESLKALHRLNKDPEPW